METFKEKVERITKHEMETGEIDPQVEMELQEMGLTDYYFQSRKKSLSRNKSELFG